MADEATFTAEIDASLRDAFLAEASAIDRPAAAIVGELMREFVERQQAARDHDAWFRSEVEAGLREADNPTVIRIPNEMVEADLEAFREKLRAQIATDDI